MSRHEALPPDPLGPLPAAPVLPPLPIPPLVVPVPPEPLLLVVPVPLEVALVELVLPVAVEEPAVVPVSSLPPPPSCTVSVSRPPQATKTSAAKVVRQRGRTCDRLMPVSLVLARRQELRARSLSYGEPRPKARTWLNEGHACDASF